MLSWLTVATWLTPDTSIRIDPSRQHHGVFWEITGSTYLGVFAFVALWAVLAFGRWLWFDEDRPES